MDTVTLWRPTGPEELALVNASAWACSALQAMLVSLGLLPWTASRCMVPRDLPPAAWDPALPGTLGSSHARPRHHVDRRLHDHAARPGRGKVSARRASRGVAPCGGTHP